MAIYKAITTSLAAAAMMTVAALSNAPEAQAETPYAAGAFGQRLIMDFEPFIPPEEAIHYENGQTGTLRDFEGKVVLATLWATWCGPCQIEMPELNEVTDIINDERLMVLPVSLDDSIRVSAPGKAAQKVRAYYDSRGLNNLKVAIDANRRNGALFYGGDPVQTPTTFVLNHEGKVIAVAPGAGVGWNSPDAEAWLRKLVDAAKTAEMLKKG